MIYFFITAIEILASFEALLSCSGREGFFSRVINNVLKTRVKCHLCSLKWKSLFWDRTFNMQFPFVAHVRVRFNILVDIRISYPQSRTRDLQIWLRVRD